jgi:hypothetical protein
MGIQVRRGNKGKLEPDRLQPGEFAVALDTDEVGIKSGGGMVWFATLNSNGKVVQNPASCGQPNGVATLNAQGKVIQAPATAYLPLPATDNGTTDKHWEKYADGRLVQWGYVGNCSTAVTTAYGSVFWRQGYTFALPSAAPAFVGNRYTNVNITSSGLLTAFNATVNSDGKTGKFDIQSPLAISSPLTFGFCYLIVGRWK